jgi:cytochrome d ubiquinol oxidase subunit I
MDLDATILARIQFGFTIGFHILFPTLTIGLGLFLVGIEALWLKTKNPVYFRLYRLWSKVFALGFGMGVVSGIVLSYQFGTNFSRFSEITGPVLGPLLSYEVMTAFFVEAGFIGVMLFGWKKVGPKLHFLATCLVALGTLNSAFWILAANSWMHTPQGAALVDGRFVPEDWWAIVFNPSFPYRLVHMVLASLLTVSFVIVGTSAWYLLKGRHEAIARRGFSLALGAAAVLAPLQIFAGDQHGLQVRDTQPIKVAAMEAHWTTGRSVPFILFAIPDEKAERNRFEIAIPYAGSLILTHTLDGEVKGLKEAKPEDRPPVFVVFITFRLMVGIGTFLFAVAMFGLWQRWRGRLYTSRFLMRLAVACVPLGFVAVIAGWMTAEIGRQPFTVYGLLRTADSVSPVPAAAVATSLALFVVVYFFLGGAFLYFVDRLIKKGPDEAEALPHGPPEPVPEAMQGARPALVVDGGGDAASGKAR